MKTINVICAALSRKIFFPLMFNAKFITHLSKFHIK